MCESHAAATVDCILVYGHTNVTEPDFRPDGHYYSAPEDQEWVVWPDDGSPGMTGIRDGAKPLCQLRADLVENHGSEWMTDRQLRAEWQNVGGNFHGPNVETATMPEDRYFAFRRFVARTQRSG